MYRAASGALVWSTGTVQWSWGLDDQHTNNPSVPVPTDVRIQQATLNVLADMGVQPTTRQPQLVAASPSTDTIPPSSTIQSPADGASGPVGTPVIISGTASDTGGVVAGVEVSTDGGTTWHPAEGTTSWSYSFTPTALGATTILSRATDDSCNIETPGAGRSFVATSRALPASIWPANATPAVASAADSSPLELGVRFRTSLDGFVTGIRFYKGPTNFGTHVGRVWTNTGQLLGTVTFTDETSTGWQTARFENAVAVSSGVTYVASYTAPIGGYAADPGGLTEAFELAPLRALAAGEDGPNGVYGNAGSFPTSSFGSSNYWVDIEFDTDNSAPPAVAEKSPAAGVSSVATTASIVVTFTESIQPASAQLSVSGTGGPVAGSSSYDSGTKSLTFTPDVALAPSTEYTVDVSGAVDLNGETMAPVSWSFTTASTPGDLPTSLWTSDDEPVSTHDDPNSLEIGLRFTSSVDGIVTALRFYQVPGAAGAEFGRLWDIAGNVLGTATFVSEAGSGWREALLDNPVQIDKDTTYVSSYYVPDGRYGATAGAFSGSSVTRGPLTAPSSDQVGGNGVYRYGTGGGFPTSTFNGTNYWADVVMEAVPDVIAPFVTNVVPAPDIQSVSPSEPIVVTFDAAVDTDDGDLHPGGRRLAGACNAFVRRCQDRRVDPERTAGERHVV